MNRLLLIGLFFLVVFGALALQEMRRQSAILETIQAIIAKHVPIRL